MEDKSNEITAIPELIEELDIAKAIACIDTIGCQRDIAHKIKDKGGHYLLLLKENQQSLYDDVISGFKACKAESIHEEWEYDYRCFEERKCNIIKAEEALLDEKQTIWVKLKTLVKVESIRTAGNEQIKETLYYISDKQAFSAAYVFSAAYYNALVREYWSIENQLH